MKKSYILILAATTFFVLSQIANSEEIIITKAPVNVPASIGLLSPSNGHFCSVGSKGVCVLTQSHEDCLKLGGQKVISCKQMIESSTTAEHSGHNDSCMAHEDSQEPVSCYGF